MKNSDIYKTWRDKLLVELSERICIPCTDERKKQYKLNFDKPLNCGCRCDRVEVILANSREIDNEIEKYSKNNTCRKSRAENN